VSTADLSRLCNGEAMGGAIHPAHGLREAGMCSALQDMEVTQHVHMLDMRTPVLHQGEAAGGPGDNATQLSDGFADCCNTAACVKDTVE